LLVRQGGQIGQVGVVEGEAGRVQRDVGAGEPDPGALCQSSVDVQLAGVEAGADVCLVDAGLGVVELPTGDRPGSTEDGSVAYPRQVTVRPPRPESAASNRSGSVNR